MATFKPVTPVLAGEVGGIVGAAITPDDRTLATGSATGAVQLWDIRSGQALGAPLPGVPASGVIPAFTPDGSRLVATYADIQPGEICALFGSTDHLELAANSESAADRLQLARGGLVAVNRRA